MKTSIFVHLLIVAATARSIERMPLDPRSKSVSYYSSSYSSSSSSSGGSFNRGSSNRGSSNRGSSNGRPTNDRPTDGDPVNDDSPNGESPNVNVPSSQPSGSSGSGGASDTSGGKQIIDTINEFRRAANLPLQTWDTQLATNAARTGQATNGKSQEHMLIPPTQGQTLSAGAGDQDRCNNDFGQYTPFELAYYSWLCEVPSDPALNGQCPQLLALSNIIISGTGHYEILSSQEYTRIGCAFTRDPDDEACGQFTGVWACDLAP